MKRERGKSVQWSFTIIYRNVNIIYNDKSFNIILFLYISYLIIKFFNLIFFYIISQYCRSASSIDAGDLNEASVASITISNESLTKSEESIIVSGKGMSSTVKVKIFLESNKVYID